MDYVDTKYVRLCSLHLRNFTERQGLFNFSCPVCGDSHKSKKKARGYIYARKGKTHYFCHNCGASMGIVKFIQTIAPDLYGAYRLEKFRNERETVSSVFDLLPKPQFYDDSIFSDLDLVDSLDVAHPVRALVERRLIPTEFYSRLYSADKFMTWANEVKPNSFNTKALYFDTQRLVIPFFSRDKKVLAFQGRLIAGTGPKYLTISLDQEQHPVFGLDRVNDQDTVYALEGPIDAMFIDNAIAIAGSALTTAASFVDKEKLVLIYDNECRNKAIVNSIEKAIKNGFNIVIWPESFKHKDINDAIISGVSKNSLMDIIKENTFNGPRASMSFTTWKRV
jgi:predicted RNA-binding Zn-ribbon protein involved in translation (DUF1610 family)